MACDNSGALLIFYYIKLVANIIFIITPIILIILCAVDIFGIVVSDEKNMKQGWNKIFKRVVVAVTILLLPVIMRLLSTFVVFKDYGECFRNATMSHIEALEAEEKEREKMNLLEKYHYENLYSHLNDDVEGFNSDVSIPRQNYLKIAASQVGTKAGKGNNVKYNDWYYGKHVEGDSYPWCAVFVSWVANQSGNLGKEIPKFRGCCKGAQWFKEHGQWRDASYVPQPGDIVFFSFGGRRYDHVGIVEYVDEKGKIHTIEGNHKGKVDRVERSDFIVGYGVPNY